jgi:cytochrome c oxidase accessory protein FixG
MCPYARFQSAMFDRDTLVIAYDPMRGEPRGPRARSLGSVLARARGLLDVQQAYDYVFRATRHPSAAAARLQAAGTITLGDLGIQAEPLPKFEPDQLGDCIDCTMCVQVCPVGIDIRNGLQYECISCGACIDACDDVMGKMGYEKGLIRYTTQNALDGRRSRILRPRIAIYAVLLAALVGGWAWSIAHRSPLIAEVLRDRNALYRIDGDRVDNGYTLKLANKENRDRTYLVTLAPTAAGLALDGGPQVVEVAAGTVRSLPLEVSGPAGIRGRHAVRFLVEARDSGTSEQVDSNFFGPM